MNIEDHCKWKYLIHSEGVSYSGRGKYLLGCESVVITHRLNWTQHFHPAMITAEKNPDQNGEHAQGNGKGKGLMSQALACV